MAQVCFTASVVGFLCFLSVLNACEWDPNTELNQGLDISSFIDGAPHVTELSEISDPEQCQKACCERDDCQLALIGTPADGLPQCRLVDCFKDGVDVCVLSQSTQFQVYRKIQDKAGPEPHNEAEVRAVNNTDHCRFPSAVGNCRAAFPRFFYDVTEQSCKPFIYGGCGGNNNNFNTKEECEASCGGVTGPVLVDTHSVAQRSRLAVPEKKDVEPSALPEMSSEEYQEKCLAPSQTGNCRASIRRFYYSNGVCQPFSYGGCGGNQNNYETEESCMTTCTVKVIPKDQKAPVAPSTNKIHSFEETCVVPFDSGLCRAAFRVFYFDASSQSCKSFVYGGCGGNLNRYNTQEECMSACSGKEGRLDELGHHKRSRWTPAFFLVATLAIMSALLLVGLILIAVRRNSHRRFMILDDKEELLPEAEQVSYEKLPNEVSS